MFIDNVITYFHDRESHWNTANCLVIFVLHIMPCTNCKSWPRLILIHRKLIDDRDTGGKSAQ